MVSGAYARLLCGFPVRGEQPSFYGVSGAQATIWFAKVQGNNLLSNWHLGPRRLFGFRLGERNFQPNWLLGSIWLSKVRGEHLPLLWAFAAQATNWLSPAAGKSFSLNWSLGPKLGCYLVFHERRMQLPGYFASKASASMWFSSGLGPRSLFGFPGAGKQLPF